MESIQDNKTELQRKQFAVREYEQQTEPKDKGLLDRVKDFVKNHKLEIEEHREQAIKNKDLYYAKYQEERKLRKGEDNIMVPKLFENWETLIPIITRTTPEPNITALEKVVKKSIIKTFQDLLLRPKKKTRAKLQELLPYKLKDVWQLSKVDGGANMQPKMEESFRNLATEKVIIMKMRWNSKFHVLEPVIVTLNDCIFATDTEDDSELTAFGHYCTYTIGELKDMGCDEDKIDELINLVRTKERKQISDRTIIKLMEYWECENVCLQYEEKIILKSFKNPSWNWKNTEFNHFPKPMIPVIVETDIRQGGSLIGASSYVEVSESLVRNVDKRKRQINRNAKLANGMYVVDGNSGISKEDSRNLGTDTDKTLYIPAGSIVPANQAVNVLTGRAIDQSVVNDMIHSESHIDKVTGVNETVRGERSASETKGGRQILKESALSRNEVLFRVNERIGQKFFNWTIQFMYVKCAEDGYPIYSSGERGDLAGIITKDMLEGTKILCYVKDGSTVPVDKSTKYGDAMDQWKEGLISRKHALMLMDVPNYEEVAREKYLEDTAPERLYDKRISENKYDPMAIMHIYDLIKGEEVPVAPMKTPEMAEKHLKTQDAYIAGEDVDGGDLPLFDELDVEIKRRIIMHTDEEAKKVAELVAKGIMKPPVEEQPQAQMPMANPAVGGMPQQMPMQQPMGMPVDPMAQAALQPQAPMQDPMAQQVVM